MRGAARRTSRPGKRAARTRERDHQNEVDDAAPVAEAARNGSGGAQDDDGIQRAYWANERAIRTGGVAPADAGSQCLVGGAEEIRTAGPTRVKV
jgi:hypothetical protein